ncbi:hypothetical protein FC83_GL001722 [Agrilactobacillus composti DSM 18527 = JCM 14202]|uniref:Uncharacterized protein n=1 Tax=Agrilactobacillus composti DSM 18527 = JCM 14202 TaxID=1423734 RepID=X0PCI4_9LACO|nr:hypothetical protein [Agrilactobacillus composti]KRM30586.1 hypothetical protein FC83_GL001722 [Agrilactobacillus composti DSM 18527 = JCM 14202]GAF38339.1 hypothetical protein JCM14202_141 [Agrilactobacillus composti DSM 18527 = JCM 14202]
MAKLKVLFTRHAGQKSDRMALYSAMASFNNFVLALVKIALGLYIQSWWLLIFGSYYVILLAMRLLLLRYYTKLRDQKHQVRRSAAQPDSQWLGISGLLFTLLGLSFGGCALIMYRGGYAVHFTKIMAIAVATIGFYKIIMAAVSFFKVRKLAHRPLLFLKGVSIVDGAVAVVLTQYALLSSENSPTTNAATGLFGMGIGLLIVSVGIVMLIKAAIVLKTNAHE